ncbi:MAG TPA: hypothetical protein VL175_12670 [Pirellulales bacterium]|nr:hypothetical protein [Pirellulales bacterium]
MSTRAEATRGATTLARWRHKLATRASALVAIWLAAICLGFAWFVDFDTRPGLPAEARSQWPADTQLALDADEHTLILFLHPHCPCSVASLEQLAALRSAAPAARFYVVASGAGAANLQDSNIEFAGSIPGVHMWLDSSGEETARFGCHTSGDVLIFDPQGRLEFSGGITAGRGDRGPNLACESALSALRNQGSPFVSAPVFGCPVRDADGR